MNAKSSLKGFCGGVCGVNIIMGSEEAVPGDHGSLDGGAVVSRQCDVVRWLQKRASSCNLKAYELRLAH